MKVTAETLKNNEAANHAQIFSYETGKAVPIFHFPTYLENAFYMERVKALQEVAEKLKSSISFSMDWAEPKGTPFTGIYVECGCVSGSFGFMQENGEANAEFIYTLYTENGTEEEDAYISDFIPFETVLNAEKLYHFIHARVTELL